MRLDCLPRRSALLSLFSHSATVNIVVSKVYKRLLISIKFFTFLKKLWEFCFYFLIVNYKSCFNLYFKTLFMEELYYLYYLYCKFILFITCNLYSLSNDHLPQLSGENEGLGWLSKRSNFVNIINITGWNFMYCKGLSAYMKSF